MENKQARAVFFDREKINKHLHVKAVKNIRKLKLLAACFVVYYSNEIFVFFAHRCSVPFSLCILISYVIFSILRYDTK